MTELENALKSQATTAVGAVELDPNRHKLPPLCIYGIPTPVEKMTQAQLRAFIPMMLKYSTGKGKPRRGKDITKPDWWPPGVPLANVRMDAREEDDKKRVKINIFFVRLPLTIHIPILTIFFCSGVLDSRSSPDRHQLLQVPQPGRPASLLCRDGGTGGDGGERGS